MEAIYIKLELPWLNKKKPRIEPIYVIEGNGKKKRIGEIIDGVLRLPRKKKHFYRNYNAWALDKNVADRLDIHTIEIYAKYENAVYTISREKFLANAIDNEFLEHKEQYFVPLQEWKRIDTKTTKV